MEDLLHRCIKLNGDVKIIKYGKIKDGRQKYKCKHCGCTFLKKYSYNAYLFSVNSELVALLNEGVGIRGISRLLIYHQQ